MDTNYIQVSAVQLLPLSKVEKDTDYNGKPIFSVEVVYILEGGRRIFSEISRQLKKDVLPAVESQDSYAKKGGLAVKIGPDGRIITTQISFGIG